MLSIKNSSLLNIENIDVLCNAANGAGPMGSGIAGALRIAGGKELQDSAIEVCKANSFINEDGKSEFGFKEGTSYWSKPGTLKTKAILHIVTMRNPGGVTTLDICRAALKHGIIAIFKREYKSLGITALGTGVGGLDKNEVAKMMMEEFLPYRNLLDIHIRDIDPDFCRFCESYL